MTRAIGTFLANQVGPTLEIETDERGHCFGRFIRIRIRFDIRNPLRRGTEIKLSKTGETHSVDFRYEKLPFFCFRCGVLTHSRDCLVNADAATANSDVATASLYLTVFFYMDQTCVCRPENQQRYSTVLLHIAPPQPPCQPLLLPKIRVFRFLCHVNPYLRLS